MKLLSNFTKDNRNKDFYKLIILHGICMNHDFCIDCPYGKEGTDGRGHCQITDCITHRYGKAATFASPANMNFGNLLELLDLKKDAPSIEELDAMNEDILKAALEIENY